MAEILSESTADRALSLKHRLHEQNGVPECWIVDPATRTLTAFKMTPEGTCRSSDPVSRRIEFHTDRFHAVVDLTAVW